jgi:alkanesulfonate monooxygenase SsuD/methylene tetrahydromethanopterin reductase-like flavin-dependent oxidoreductase (luciferase family)
VLSVPETMCYPRPVQERVPLIVGGGGERRTLRLAARYADHANVFGDLATVRRKAAVLAAHCRDAGRDVGLTHLSTTLVGRTDADVAALVDRLRPRNRSAAAYAAGVHAGTVADHVGRFRELADAGVGEVMVRLPDLTDPAPFAAFSEVVGAFR